MARIVDGLASKPYPGGRGETGIDLPWVVSEYEDVFLDELPRLPLHRDVDLCIELHPSKLLISMTHRMAPIEL